VRFYMRGMLLQTGQPLGLLNPIILLNFPLGFELQKEQNKLN
jgi:hypothetical protein